MFFVQLCGIQTLIAAKFLLIPFGIDFQLLIVAILIKSLPAILWKFYKKLFCL